MTEKEKQAELAKIDKEIAKLLKYGMKLALLPAPKRASTAIIRATKVVANVIDLSMLQSKKRRIISEPIDFPFDKTKLQLNHD